ncbi:hypothetical protein [Singulisphaera sp. PoT]|uniref:hypothetical protein n=1 Tax=Singulisphaera sp. PoT TaxID=3411797 RepID=UPI003BF5A5DA
MPTSATSFEKFSNDVFTVHGKRYKSGVWLVSKDVCRELELSGHSYHVKGQSGRRKNGKPYRIEGVGKANWRQCGRTVLVNRCGVDMLVGKSRSEMARKFWKWAEEKIYKAPM